MTRCNQPCELYYVLKKDHVRESILNSILAKDRGMLFNSKIKQCELFDGPERYLQFPPDSNIGCKTCFRKMATYNKCVGQYYRKQWSSYKCRLFISQKYELRNNKSKKGDGIYILDESNEEDKKFFPHKKKKERYIYILYLKI